MAATTLKESLQCFAFAYFAHNNVIDTSHLESWYDIFNPDNPADDRELEKTYGQYLSKTFDHTVFSQTLAKYRSTVTSSGKISVDGAVKKVYLVVKKVVNSNFFTTSLSHYVFLDQSDPFTILVKDTCLSRVANAFDSIGKADLLSPVDIFIVKKSKVGTIFQDFYKNILNADDDEILSNMAWGKSGKNTYRTISNKYFKSKDLVGVSLKLPESIGGAGVLKIVGSENVEPHLLDFVDPYTKFLAAILAHPNKTKDLIEKIVDIEFDNFRITPDILSWEYPITFRYNDVVDPRTKQALHKQNLRFKLMTWDKAGFNAQWYKGQGAPGNWTGGAGIQPLGELFVKYKEYSTILDEVIEIRRKAFFQTIHGSTKDPKSKISKDLKDDYEKALKDVEKKTILTNDQSKNLIEFLKKFSGNTNKYNVYLTKTVKDATKVMKNASRTITNDPKRLYSHYVASQCAWFLFRGGKSLHKYLKQRMFLSLFGLITKSGYKIFQGNEDTIIENYLQKTYKKNKKNVTAYFAAAPHLVLS